MLDLYKKTVRAVHAIFLILVEQCLLILETGIWISIKMKSSSIGRVRDEMCLNIHSLGS